MEVNITLKGNGNIFRSVEDEEDSGECREFCVILENIEVYANDEDITKQKGKYVKSKSYIKDRYMVLDEPPYWFYKIDDTMAFEFHYTIECDEFEPKKLQLIKSDYELEFLPYGVMTDTILYDGQEYECNDGDFDDNTTYGMCGVEVIEHPYEIPFC